MAPTAAATAAAPQPASYMGSIYSWAGAALGTAQDALNSFLGWEDLEVVDPEQDAAAVITTVERKRAEAHNQEERKKAWGTHQFQQYIGMDVTSLLSVPVWIMEPFSILQKMAEIMEYTHLLDLADQCDDPDERFALVAAYLVSPFGASERAWKPFNPILGETFEVEGPNGMRYLAEQVSHHPPVGAAHAENSHWQYDLVSAPTTKFLGNSLEIYPHGRTRVKLRRSGELFTHTPPNALANNIVLGRTWVDAAGTFYVGNVSTGASCTLNFTPCGWFGHGRYEFSGYIQDASGVKKLLLQGKWNSYCEVLRCDANGGPLPGEVPRRLWTCADKPKGDYYGYTHFAHALNSCDGLSAPPLPSDSRRRPDRAALEEGDTLTAGVEKHRMEEMQRAERRHRADIGDSYQPRWFRLLPDAKVLDGECGTDKVPFWAWAGSFPERHATSFAPDCAAGVGFNCWQYPSIHADA